MTIPPQPADPASVEPPTGPVVPEPEPGSAGLSPGESAPPERTAWVGRATAPIPPPPPAEDPWWQPPPDPYERGYTAPYPVVMAPRPRRSGLRVLLLVAGLFAACCAGGLTVALLTTTNKTGSGTIGQAPPGLNSVVKDGQFEFVVTGVSCGHDTLGTLVKASAKGQYCVVDVRVTNTGTEARAFTEGLQRALDLDGNAYSADSGAGVIVNMGFATLWNMVDPDTTMTGKIVYDIPDGASIAKLELHEAVFSRGTVVTL